VTKVGLLEFNLTSSSYLETLGSCTFSLHLRHIKLLKLKKCLFLKRVDEVNTGILRKKRVFRGVFEGNPEISLEE
jgi:hypothetical protein